MTDGFLVSELTWNGHVGTVRAGVALTVLTALAYVSVLGGELTFDDRAMVVENEIVTEAQWWALLTTSYWSGITGQEGGLYRPLTMVNLAAQHALFGDHSSGYRLVSIVLHAVTGLALFLVVRRLLASPRALTAAALFCLHPINSEVVSTSVGNAESLALLLSLLALYFLFADRTWFREMEAASLLVLAQLAKESAAVVAIAVALAGAYARNRRLAVMGLTATAVGLGFRLAITERLGPGPIGFLDNPLSHLPPFERIGAGLTVGVLYLTKFVVPWPLVADYSFDQIRAPERLGDAHVVAAATFLLSL
ncbi:uncharacterized protein METZ01_LOCUS312293, partial [marine metagenome]